MMLQKNLFYRDYLQYATANVEDKARLDVSARGFRGGRHQRSFFDVRVFNPTASGYCDPAIPSLHRRFEREKQGCSKGSMRWKWVHSPLSFFFDFWGNGWCNYHCFQKNCYLTVSKKRSTLQSDNVLAIVLHQLFLVVVHYNLLVWSLFHLW